jgi:hypothetical protein
MSGWRCGTGRRPSEEEEWRQRELGSYARGGELLLLGLRHGDEQPGVEGDGELAPGEAGAACGHAL